MIGSTLYLVGVNKRNGEYISDNYPCTLCKRMIINAGIKRVVIRESYPDELAQEMAREAGLQIDVLGV